LWTKEANIPGRVDWGVTGGDKIWGKSSSLGKEPIKIGDRGKGWGNGKIQKKGLRRSKEKGGKKGK